MYLIMFSIRHPLGNEGTVNEKEKEELYLESFLNFTINHGKNYFSSVIQSYIVSLISKSLKKNKFT